MISLITHKVCYDRLGQQDTSCERIVLRNRVFDVRVHVRIRSVAVRAKVDSIQVHDNELHAKRTALMVVIHDRELNVLRVLMPNLQ